MTLSLASRRGRPVPVAYRSNFNHLVMDIAWFGVLNGSAIAFVSIYATRLGADAFQLGLLSALPAIVNMTFALPAGRWLQDKPTGPTTFAASVVHRAFYVSWIFLPMFLLAQGQIWALLITTLLMSIPGTVLAISFNGMFAAAVPPDWRAQVVGARNAAFAITSIVTSLLCGRILTEMPLTSGYQIVFFIGVVGAAMSCFHLWKMRPPEDIDYNAAAQKRERDWAQPGVGHTWNSLKTTVGLRFLIRRDKNGVEAGQWRLPLSDTRFRQVLTSVFLMHVTMFLAIPLFPLFTVNELGLSDNIIGWGNGIFYMSVFLGSMQLVRASEKVGHRKAMALGLMVMALYPVIISQANGAAVYLLASAVGGLGWAISGGALGNYVLEFVPREQRTGYLAWYNIALQGGVLLGSLLAPNLAGLWGLTMGLLFAALCRFLVGAYIWRQH